MSMITAVETVVEAFYRVVPTESNGRQKDFLGKITDINELVRLVELTVHGKPSS